LKSEGTGCPQYKEIEDQGAARPAVKKNEVLPENAKKKLHKFLSLCPLHCNPAKSLIFAKILPRITHCAFAPLRYQASSVISEKSTVQFFQFHQLIYDSVPP